MRNRKITLRQAVSFHGHLGPYLVIGLLMGEYALKKIKARPHLGLEVKVYGAVNKPKSCLIDGLQLSTGCTYGKGNITKFDGKIIRADFINRNNKKSIQLALKPEIVKQVQAADNHYLSEKLARELYNKAPGALFKVTLRNLL